MSGTSFPFAGPISILAVAAGVAVGLVACGGEQPPPPNPDPASFLPLKTPSATPAPVEAPTAEASAAPSAEPSAAPSASASAQASAPESSGRPPVLKMDEKSITDTFGAAPAKLELGGDKDRAVLVIPENALDRGYNITFEIDAKGKSHGGQVGKIYRTRAQVAGSPEFTKVPTSGAPFQLALPAGAKKDANLAIGVVSTDDKGREKITWTVMAPKKIDDATNTAYFELPAIDDAYLHVTTKPADAAK